MSNLKAGAWRPARDSACYETLTAADDLVRRTLARHGLWSEQGTGTETSMPARGLMTGLHKLTPRQSRFRPEAGSIDPASGAVFRSNTYTGRTGSRDFLQYVPASASDGVTGLVVLLHGCTQTPEDFAIGTGMNSLAEAHRLVVIYPGQSRGANAQTCWNWFSKGDQRRDRGEPDILAGIARSAMAEHGLPPERVFVAGLSAGAAMAVILGETYPDVFAAVGAHSGLPFGAAHDVPSAFAAMGGDLKHAASARTATSPVRTIVFHGAADRTVHPANGAEIARRVENAQSDQTLQTMDRGARGGRAYHRTRVVDSDGKVLSEHWLIDGLGHAWSGGDGRGTYTDPAGPDASAEMVRFFLEPGRGA